MTTVPTWTAVVVSVGTPIVTFVGVLIAQVVGRKGDRELETRSKREETMRNLRWAAELAVSTDEAEAKLGVAQLNALGDSTMLDDAQQLFVTPRWRRWSRNPSKSWKTIPTPRPFEPSRLPTLRSWIPGANRP